jgi:hypothetical protein
VNEYRGVIADHHVFVIPGIVDAKVVEEQANKKYVKREESTYIHYHAKHATGQPQVVDNEVQCLGYEHTEVGNVSHRVKLP